MGLGFDQSFAVCELRPVDDRYRVVLNGTVVGLQDIHGNHFYIRRNGRLRVSKTNCNRAEYITPYKLVSVWNTNNCECKNFERVLLDNLVSKLCGSSIDIETADLDSWRIYEEETGYKTNTEMTIVSIDFRINEQIKLNCTDELPC